MPFTETLLSDGTAVTWAGIEANRDDFIAWANAVPDGDVQAAAIKREHLARPSIFGFPVNGLKSTFQSLLGQTVFGYGGDFQDESSFASRHERMFFDPYRDVDNDGRLFLPIGKRVEVDLRARVVEAHCTFDYQSQSNAGYDYPTGGATGTAGHFSLFAYSHSLKTITELNQSRQDAYSIQSPLGSATIHRDNFHLSHTATFAAGTWDVFLGYVLDGTTTNLFQIDLTRIAFTCEVA